MNITSVIPAALLGLWLTAAPIFAQTSLQGAITGPKGAALSGISVRLEPGALEQQSTAEGRFSFDTLATGVYSLVVYGRGYVPLEQTVTVGTKTVMVNLQLTTVQTTIEVRDRADDFLATNSVSITKSPESLVNLSYTVQVIPRALLEDRAIHDVKDLYRNISGVTDSPYSAMTFRGFTQREVLFNGVRGNPYGSLENDINDAGFSTSQGRLSNIEFVEVLKGPAAVLFGAGEPGGIINFVTKKPNATPAIDLGFRVGSFHQLGGQGEITGPLWKSKNLFGRAAWYQEDRKTFRYNSGNENVHLATGLAWRFGESTSLGFEYEYIDQLLTGNRLRGIPVNAAGLNLTNREWSANEPTDFSGLQARVFQTRLDHAFTSTLRTDVTFRYLNFDRPERYHEPRGLLADGRTMRREFRNQYRANNDYSVTANGYQRWNGGHAGAHNFIFGVEAVRQDWTGRYGRAREPQAGGPVPPIDLFNPIYGLTDGSRYPITAFTSQQIQSSRSGFFFQDQIELLPRLQISLGGRVEHFVDEGTAPTPLNFKTTGVTGRAGMVYRIASNLSAYGSYSNSFTRPPALAQSPLANGPFEPELGRQIEGGVKSQLAHGRVLLTSSVFRITKRNVLRPDPNLGPKGDNSSAVLPIGRVRNQGFEFDATGRVTRDLSVIVNYSFLDSVIVADRLTPSAIGRPLPNAARHAFGLFVRYDIRKTGTGITIGNESRGRRYEPYAGIQAAGYGLWDFGVFQKLHKMVELRVQLDNAFDRNYALSSLFAARAGNMPGAPRTVTASLRFSTNPRPK